MSILLIDNREQHAINLLHELIKNEEPINNKIKRVENIKYFKKDISIWNNGDFSIKKFVLYSNGINFFWLIILYNKNIKIIYNE